MALRDVDDEDDLRELCVSIARWTSIEIGRRSRLMRSFAMNAELNRRPDELIALTQCNALLSIQGVSEWTPE